MKKIAQHLLVITFSISFTLMICLGCARLPMNESGPQWPTNEFRTSTPERQGVDSQGIIQLLEANIPVGLNSLLIMKNGYLITEAYYHDFNADMPHFQASVTKSITAALVGIAIEEGYIKNIDQRVIDFFPEVDISNDILKETMTIRHLMEMKSGLRPHDPQTDDEFGDDWGRYVLGIERIFAPGTMFSYDDFHLFILGSIMHRAVGMSLYEYAQEKLFGPLGMTSVSWEADPNGVNFPGFGITMTPRDMMRFGFLILHDGLWDGQQVVSVEWIQQLKATGIDMANNSYGLLFWHDVDIVYAAGMYGQHIIIYPDLDMVIVNTSELDFSKDMAVNNFPEYVHTDPLKRNAGTQRRLAGLIRGRGIASVGNEDMIYSSPPLDLSSIMSPSQSPWVLRVNGYHNDDSQVSIDFMPLQEGETYILSANILEINPVHESHADYSSVLRFRIFNQDSRDGCMYWVNGVFFDTRTKWDEIDSVHNRPGFNEFAEVTPLTGEWEGWHNVKMVFTVPTVGHVIWGWGWTTGLRIEDDYTLTIVDNNHNPILDNDGNPLKDNSSESVISMIQNWALALQIQRFGKNYLIDNMLFYPESEGEEGNLNPSFNDSQWGAAVYTPDADPGQPVWLLLPAANAR